MRLTVDFSREEFDVSGPIPPQYEGDVLRLALLLQRVRDALGVPLTLTSVYRTSARNRAVGGVPTSQHLTAQAADAVPGGGLTRAEVVERIMAGVRDGRITGYGQIIVYGTTHHVHVSLPHAGHGAQLLYLRAPGEYVPLSVAVAEASDAAEARRTTATLGGAAALAVGGALVAALGSRGR